MKNKIIVLENEIKNLKKNFAEWKKENGDIENVIINNNDDMNEAENSKNDIESKSKRESIIENFDINKIDSTDIQDSMKNDNNWKFWRDKKTNEGKYFKKKICSKEKEFDLAIKEENETEYEIISLSTAFTKIDDMYQQEIINANIKKNAWCWSDHLAYFIPEYKDPKKVDKILNDILCSTY